MSVWCYIDCRALAGQQHLPVEVSFYHIFVDAGDEQEAYTVGARRVAQLTDAEKRAQHGHFDGRFLNDYAFEAQPPTSATAARPEWRRMSWSHVQTSKDGRFRIEERSDGWMLYARNANRTFELIGVYPTREATQAAADAYVWWKDGC